MRDSEIQDLRLLDLAADCRGRPAPITVRNLIAFRALIKRDSTTGKLSLVRTSAIASTVTARRALVLAGNFPQKRIGGIIY